MDNELIEIRETALSIALHFQTEEMTVEELISNAKLIEKYILSEWFNLLKNK